MPTYMRVQISKTWRAFDDGEVFAVRLRRVITWYPFLIAWACRRGLTLAPCVILALPPRVILPCPHASRAACQPACLCARHASTAAGAAGGSNALQFLCAANCLAALQAGCSAGVLCWRALLACPVCLPNMCCCVKPAEIDTSADTSGDRSTVLSALALLWTGGQQSMGCGRDGVAWLAATRACATTCPRRLVSLGAACSKVKLK